jgi:hypothetical protein
MSEPDVSDVIRALRDQVWLRDTDLNGERGQSAWERLTGAQRDSAIAVAEVRALRLELQGLRVVIGNLAMALTAVSAGEPVDHGALLSGVDDALASTRAAIRDDRTG